jgi:ubiquinone/menaquinone biosynthesis C-methylase UbiE
VGKPFSDPDCARYLADISAIISLLPPLPARLLDVGCGTGWTSLFFARIGYEVVGVDIADDMVELANKTALESGLKNINFMTADYETMSFDNEFDCAVFFDSLHHSVDENLAIKVIYKALKPNGRCITDEPGRGHGSSEVSLEAVNKFQVTERDMPPGAIFRAGKKAGFKHFYTFPYAYNFIQLTYRLKGTGIDYFIRKLSNKIKLFGRTNMLKHGGITLMVK